MTKTIKLVLYEKSPDHDSMDVRFEIDGEEKGFGFCDIEKTYIALVRCPFCGKENYALNVLSGQCTWCPFNTKDAFPK